jgi:hypothetical protein
LFDAEGTHLTKVDTLRLASDMQPNENQYTRTAINPMDVSEIHPFDDNRHQQAKVFNKDDLINKQNEINYLELNYHQQETAFLQKVLNCKNEQEKKAMESNFFKARQEAKDMINGLKQQLVEMTRQADIQRGNN